MSNRKPNGKKSRQPEKYSKEFWKAVVEEREREGLSYEQAAQRYKVASSTICSWAKKLGKTGAGNARPGTDKAPMRLVEVSPLREHKLGYEIRFPSGITLSLSKGLETAEIVEVVSGLLERCHS